MNPPRRQLEGYFQGLLNSAYSTVDNLRPEHLSVEHLVSQDRKISKRYAVYAIAVSFTLAVVSIGIGEYLYPDYRIPLALTSIALTFVVSFYFVLHLSEKSSRRYIERHNTEKEQWMRDLAHDPEYLQASETLISRCYAVISLNNYFILKELVISQEKRKEPYYLVTPVQVREVLANAENKFTYSDAVVATIRVVQDKIIQDHANLWVDKTYGAINLIQRPEFQDAFNLFEAITTTLVQRFADVTSRHVRDIETEEDYGRADVVSFIDFKKGFGGNALTPAQKQYLELSRVFELLTKIIDPLLDKARIIPADPSDPATKALVHSAEKELKNLKDEVDPISEAILSQRERQRAPWNNRQ